MAGTRPATMVMFERQVERQRRPPNSELSRLQPSIGREDLGEGEHLHGTALSAGHSGFEGWGAEIMPERCAMQPEPRSTRRACPHALEGAGTGSRFHGGD